MAQFDESKVINALHSDKAEEYADKMLSDSKYPFIFNKQKVKAYIIKVYLDSLKCCEEAYNKGLVEGRKEKQVIIDTQTVQIESRDVYLAEKENIILRQQSEIEKLKVQIESMTSVLKEIANYSDCKASENMAKKELKKWRLAE